MDLWSSFPAGGAWRIRVAASLSGIRRLDIAPAAGPAWEAPDGCRPAGNHALFAEARLQLEEYFAGRRRVFDLPLDLRGTPFQLRVWNELLRIPYGETRSYSWLARRAGSVPRAAGQANGRNPVAILVPCHRVVNVDGSLGGYAGGLDCKRWLLELESRALVLTAAER
mgnify:CR=1 FL=1